MQTYSIGALEQVSLDSAPLTQNGCALQSGSVLDKDLAHDGAGAGSEGLQESGIGEASSSGLTGHRATERLGRRAWWRRCRECLSEVLLPVTVVVLGVGFSLAALWVSLSKMLWPPDD